VQALCFSNLASGQRWPKPDANAVLWSTGEVHWLPYYNLEVMCTFDITYYPFDQQKCKVTVEMWTTSDLEVQICLHCFEL
jgi:nicotinic acetylcholine receptor alpha-2